MHLRMRSIHARQRRRATPRARACRRIRIREEHRAERDVPSPGRDELERVETRLHAAHADDRHLRRPVARRDGRERDRLRAPDPRGLRCPGPSAGRSVLLSSFRPRIVFTSERPSAPAACAARATSAMSGHCRRELRPQRLSCAPAARRATISRRALGRRFDVRAGHVQLDRAHLGVIVQPRADLGVVVASRTRRPTPRPARRARRARGRLRVEEAVDARDSRARSS